MELLDRGCPRSRATRSLLDPRLNSSVLAAPLAGFEMFVPKALKAPSVLTQAVTRLVELENSTVPPWKYQVSRSSSRLSPEILSSMTSSSSSDFMPNSLLDLLSS